jgi:cytidylate kinase
MYRAVTWVALQRGIELGQEASLERLAQGLAMRLVPAQGGDRLLVNGQDITDHLSEPEVESGVSLVARVPGVRKAMVKHQRAIAGAGPIVMVGRDIGTVVLPAAAVKVYLTASVEVRARRRHQDLQRRGDPVDYAQVVSETVRRDKIDSERADSPLRPAGDAVVIDTDDLGVEELAQKVLCLVGHD